MSMTRDMIPTPPSNARQWERVIGEAMAREALKAERDAKRDIGIEKWVWDAVAPSARDHLVNCGGAVTPHPKAFARQLSPQVLAALCTAWATGPNKVWRVSDSNARLLRPYGLCEAGRGIHLTNFGRAVHQAATGSDA